jgi:AcrR family transcriptional regulator
MAFRDSIPGLLSPAAVVRPATRLYRRRHVPRRSPISPRSGRPDPECRRQGRGGMSGAGRKRSRNDPRHEATRNALLETAEAMFAASGINGVSLRQIGIAIGSANANVVGYYFGDKEALIEAILLKHRLPIEEARQRLWDRARADGSDSDLLVLIDILWRPLFEKTNSAGLHTYAAFLGSMSRSSFHALRLAIADRLPATSGLVARISELLPALPEKYLRGRLHVLNDVITGVLQRIDIDQEDGVSAELLYRDALRMAQAILAAPIESELLNHDRASQAGSIVFV